MRYVLFLVGMLVGAQQMHAVEEFTHSRGWLHVNGYSHHFAAPEANDKLLGLGFSWYTRRFGRVLTAWEADAFQDSDREFSAYIGHSWTFGSRFLSIGVTGALMYHRNFRNQNELRLLPVAIPFVETRGAVKLRLYYIPPVRSPSDHQIALQLMIPLFR